MGVCTVVCACERSYVIIVCVCMCVSLGNYTEGQHSCAMYMGGG